MFPDAPALNGQMLRIAKNFFKILSPEACKLRVGLYFTAIWHRVKRFERRFCKLYELWKAGRLPPARLAGAGAAHPSPRPPPTRGGGGFDPHAPGGASWVMALGRPASVLPRTFAWLPKMLPWSGGALLGGVESLLCNFPEMKAFAAQCPQVRRILRPICRMAGMKVPEWLALPRRRRTSPPTLSAKRRGRCAAADGDAAAAGFCQCAG